MFKYNRYSIEARYDGRTKYEKPRYSYRYNYKYNHVDTSLPVTEWAYQWYKNTKNDFGEFLLDLTLRGNINAVMFKVAGFTKRQAYRAFNLVDWLLGQTWSIWQAIKHGVKHMIHGLKALANDGKWVVKHSYSSQKTTFTQRTYS